MGTEKQGRWADGQMGGSLHAPAHPPIRPSDYAVIGTARPKTDAPGKVVGQTLFADDIVLPRMLWCKLLRSPHPHARITSIDTTRARAVDGVIAVLTGADMPVAFGILPVSQDEHALCQNRVRFIGDPVAAVAAVDEETALSACDLIDVVYDPLQPIASVDEAAERPAPQLHEYADQGNWHKLVHLEFGDLESGFAKADLVREDLFFYEGNTHLPMEQHAAIAQATPDGRLTIWSSTQTPHYVHRALSKVLELPPSRIRVIATPNGGAFGGKSDPFNHEIVVAKLSLVTGRPVKIGLTREEVFYCHRGRHQALMKIRTGVTHDGAITAMDFESYLDGGAYGSYGVASLYYTGALQTVTYDVPTYRFRGARAFTNKPPGGPKRGHGTTQPRFAVEVHLDKIAEQLGMDPADLRLRHLVKPHSVTATSIGLPISRRIEPSSIPACSASMISACTRSPPSMQRNKLPCGASPSAGCAAKHASATGKGRARSRYRLIKCHCPTAVPHTASVQGFEAREA